MSTNDVPGHKPENRDQLAMGAWAEHEDGSLIVVESTEGGRVVYSMFDMSLKPIIEFRDAMAEGAFKALYSWAPGKKDKWTWHDKTPFVWDRVIKAGARPGAKYASAADQLSEANRVRKRRAKTKTAAKRARRAAAPPAPVAAVSEPDNAAQRARKAREITQGEVVQSEAIEHRLEKVVPKAGGIRARIQAAISRLPWGK